VDPAADAVRAPAFRVDRLVVQAAPVLVADARAAAAWPVAQAAGAPVAAAWPVVLARVVLAVAVDWAVAKIPVWVVDEVLE
jgi:hypothetical protein